MVSGVEVQGACHAFGALDKLVFMARPQYIHQHCMVCESEEDFKLLDEQDGHFPTFMVCTQCGQKIPVLGCIPRSS